MISTTERLRVVVVYNHSPYLIKGEQHDMLAEQGVLACAETVAAALAERCDVRSVPIHADVEIALADYSPSEWTIFNLGEGIQGRLFEEARIAWALEAMGYRMTGSRGPALARSIHKAHAKQLFERAGVPTPPWRVFRNAQEAEDGLGFPVIVKPVAEDGSLGIGLDAVAQDSIGLRERVEYIATRYRQASLVERFIAGREFNVSLWGDPPEPLPLAEIDFGDFADPLERIVSFEAKWDRGSFAFNHTPVLCPAEVSPQLGRRIRDAALGAWHAIGCEGYARVDMRVDEQEQPFVVEVNCNPDLSPDAGFYQAARGAGFSYTDMIWQIARLSLP